MFSDVSSWLNSGHDLLARILNKWCFILVSASRHEGHNNVNLVDSINCWATINLLILIYMWRYSKIVKCHQFIATDSVSIQNTMQRNEKDTAFQPKSMLAWGKKVTWGFEVFTFLCDFENVSKDLFFFLFHVVSSRVEIQWCIQYPVSFIPWAVFIYNKSLHLRLQMNRFW